MKKLSQKDFIDSVKDKIPDIDFSESIYVNDATKIVCICKKCGRRFSATPNNIKHGRGCPFCSHKSEKYTIEEIKEMIKSKYKDLYDTSLITEYTGRQQKLPLICKKHGYFEKSLASLMHGFACPGCTKERMAREKNEWFINEARKVHLDKYDYSLIDFKGLNQKVRIICPKHGEFLQIARGHLRGHGCPKCAKTGVRLTTEEFIERARKVHGNKYDYSKVEYINSETKVCIICPKHGEFWQVPHKHLNGRGCHECLMENSESKCTTKKTTERFIMDARKVHGDKYDYSKVVYKGSFIPVKIICPIHGEFEQKPNKHLEGSGCQICAKGAKTTEQFIKEARVVHGDKYDYSKVEYKTAKTKIKIICPVHGEFEQTPDRHLKGRGCPSCNQSHLENSIEQFLTEKGINFTKRAHFPWLGSQHLDFYLTDYNVAIECQGRQHFVPVEFFGGEDGLKSTMERDERKSKLCNDKGVELLYFTYYEGIKEEGNIYKNKDKLLEKIMSTKCL